MNSRLSGSRRERKIGIYGGVIMYMAIGLCLGVAFGTALDNLPLGIAIGVAVGAGIDSSRSSKRKKIKKMKIYRSKENYNFKFGELRKSGLTEVCR